MAVAVVVSVCHGLLHGLGKIVGVKDIAEGMEADIGKGFFQEAEFDEGEAITRGVDGERPLLPGADTAREEACEGHGTGKAIDDGGVGEVSPGDGAGLKHRAEAEDDFAHEGAEVEFFTVGRPADDEGLGKLRDDAGDGGAGHVVHD